MISGNIVEYIDQQKIIYGTTISISLKAIKNATEITHIKQAMIKDGVALTRLYRWIETAQNISEVDIAAKLDHFRTSQEMYYGESFILIFHLFIILLMPMIRVFTLLD